MHTTETSLILSRVAALIAAIAATALTFVGLDNAARAAETIQYRYDAKGRLVKVVRSDAPGLTVTTDYEHDKADNRVRVKTVVS